MIRTYSELITFQTFEDRYEYLKLSGTVGEETFGFDRYLNQAFYTSKEWKKFRRDIIVRDLGCDLGINDREIKGLIIVHHLNPITIRDITNKTDFLMTPEYVVCVSDNTHKAIHYGDESLLITAPIKRCKNDTCPWRH